ncbi:MAG: sigma 54-interacting transcriptional regulator, partial [Gemmatimonadaceae bacterium]
MPSVLIVDDEPNIRRMVGALLRAEDYEVREAADGTAAVRCVEDEEPDIALIDLMMPGQLDGIATLSKIRERWSDLPVIMMSGRASLGDAVRATRLGAVNFLEKPLTPESVLLALSSALELRQTRRDARALRAELGLTGDMVGTSNVMDRVRELIGRVAPSDARVLISGESGTGKELVAAAIHEHSPRRDRPLVRVNCAAIPRDLVESEMFGHEKGSFTGAAERRIGRFELADTGTLFLDEIGDLSTEAQAKLLRAIEAKEIQRVGGNKTIRIDVRVVAATNRDLGQAVKNGTFREDLYFRLNVIPVLLPPLRERGDDVVELVRHFSILQHQRTGRPMLQWSDGALALMRNYPWPGNVRELANIVERIAILSGDARVSSGDVSAVLPSASMTTEITAGAVRGELSLTDALDDAERTLISEALASASGNVAEAARRLKTDRANLYRRMKRLGMAGAASMVFLLGALAATIALTNVAGAQQSPRAAERTATDTLTSPGTSRDSVARDTLGAFIGDSIPLGASDRGIHVGLSLTSGKTYNRVEGLPILVGPSLTLESRAIAVDAAAYGIIRTGDGWRLDEPHSGHNVRLAMRFGPDRALGISGSLYDVVAPIERWQLSEPEEGLASFLLRRDYLDYYGRHGARVGASWVVNEKAAINVGYGSERWSSREAQNPFTLFRENGHWRANPQMDEGVIHLATVAATFDTRNDVENPSGGWFLRGAYEYGTSPSLTRAPRVQQPAQPSISPLAVDRSVTYGRAFFDLRRYNRVSPKTQVNGRLVAAGWVHG